MTYLTAHPSKFVSDHIRKAQTGIHPWLQRAYYFFFGGGGGSISLTFVFCYYLNLGELQKSLFKSHFLKHAINFRNLKGPSGLIYLTF